MEKLPSEYSEGSFFFFLIGILMPENWMFWKIPQKSVS